MDCSWVESSHGTRLSWILQQRGETLDSILGRRASLGNHRADNASRSKWKKSQIFSSHSPNFAHAIEGDRRPPARSGSPEGSTRPWTRRDGLDRINQIRSIAQGWKPRFGADFSKSAIPEEDRDHSGEYPSEDSASRTAEIRSGRIQKHQAMTPHLQHLPVVSEGTSMPSP